MVDVILFFLLVCWIMLGGMFYFDLLNPTTSNDFKTRTRYFFAVLIGGPGPMLCELAIKAANVLNSMINKDRIRSIFIND